MLYKITDTPPTAPLTEFTVNEIRIGVAFFKDKYFAFAARCPHGGVPLCDGWLDGGGNVVCPHHNYKFCVRTGRNVSGEGYMLKRYTLEQREDGLYIDL